MIRGGDHEAWLSEQVPKWETLGEEQLAAEIRDVAEEIEYPQVFEHGNVERDHDDQISDTHRSEADITELSADATEVMREARELTRKRRENIDDKEPSGKHSETE
jgi:hypothetical protein